MHIFILKTHYFRRKSVDMVIIYAENYRKYLLLSTFRIILVLVVYHIYNTLNIYSMYYDYMFKLL